MKSWEVTKPVGTKVEAKSPSGTVVYADDQDFIIRKEQNTFRKGFLV
jgi:hypothetical protein